MKTGSHRKATFSVSPRNLPYRTVKIPTSPSPADRLEGSQEYHELLQRGLGQSPGRKRIQCSPICLPSLGGGGSASFSKSLNTPSPDDFNLGGGRESTLATRAHVRGRGYALGKKKFPLPNRLGRLGEHLKPPPPSRVRGRAPAKNGFQYFACVTECLSLRRFIGRRRLCVGLCAC